jgi:hypothetical protein
MTEVSMDDETIPTHKRAALWVFDQLLREGVIVYTSLLNIEGVDAVVRCQDGHFRDLVIRASENEHYPNWFAVSRLQPRDNLLVVCVSWQVTPVQCWIFPSDDFIRNAAKKGSANELDLEADAPEGGGKLKQTLSMYRNAWRLVTDGAFKPYAR